MNPVRDWPDFFRELVPAFALGVCVSEHHTHLYKKPVELEHLPSLEGAEAGLTMHRHCRT